MAHVSLLTNSINLESPNGRIFRGDFSQLMIGMRKRIVPVEVSRVDRDGGSKNLQILGPRLLRAGCAARATIAESIRSQNVRAGIRAGPLRTAQDRACMTGGRRGL
jgi:hypothetical protein